MLDFSLDRHDKNQVELKLKYGLRADEDIQKYQVETFIFVPRALAITPETYGPSEFYHDTATFIRLTAPRVPLSQLSSKSAVKPWASDVKAEIDRFASGEDGDIESAERGLMLLACVFKGAVKDAHTTVREALERVLAAEDYDTTSTLLAEFCTDIETALARLHKVGDRSGKSGVPAKLRESWRAVDEYASLLAEEAITDLVSLCPVQSEFDPLKKALENARELAVAQYHLRRNLGCSTYATEGMRNEHLPRRWRVLKRYVSSALYLTVERESTEGVASNLVGMFAAAMAMLFATAALLVIQATWNAELSIAFMAAMVISYVIKDRIKELGKRRLRKRLQQRMPDHKVRIVGLAGQKIGSAEETFHVHSTADIPEDITAWRVSDLDSREAVTGRPETVLCHQKRINLSSEQLRKQFAGAQGLLDIVRLNMRPMMVRMTDAWETYRYIHPDTHELRQTQCARVYHINIIIRLTEGDGRDSIHRVRVVVNKKGIVRVESIEPVANEINVAINETADSTNIQIFDD